MRLDCIEQFLTTINSRTRDMEEKIDQLMFMAKQNGQGQGTIKKGYV